MNSYRIEQRFEHYLERLEATRDYANYVTETLIRLGREENLDSTIGAFDLYELEILFVEIIGKVRELNLRES